MSRRIDWRNYDYSEGPPKPHRDTNPYSKSTNYRTRESSTSSPVNFPNYPNHSNSYGNNINNGNNGNDISNSNSNTLNLKTNSLHTNNISSPVPAAALSVTSPDSHSDSNAMDHFRVSTHDCIKDHKSSSSYGTSKLIYRPPGHIQTQATPFDEMEPIIPSRRRMPLGGEEEEPFDAIICTQPTTVAKTVARPVIPSRKKENDHKVNLRMNVPNDVQETVQLSTKTRFDALWNEAGEDWNNEDVGAAVQHYISDDDDDDNEEGQFVGNCIGEDGNMAGTTSKLSTTEALKSSPGRTIASEASVGLMEVARSTNMATNSPGESYSDASLGMEVADIRMSSVSILRNNSRCADQEKENQENIDSVESSPSRRKHPWDQDGECAPMDEVAEEEHANPAILVEESEEEEIENTNLSQYEADEQEVAAMTKEDTIKKKGKSSPASVANREVNQETFVPNHILRNDNTDVDRKEKRRRSRKHDDIPEEEDDSIAGLEGNLKIGDTLRDRTKQAWSKRNQSTGSLPAAIVPTPEFHSSGRINVNGEPRRSLVAFQQNTVHEFVPEEGESGTESDGATEVTDYTEYTHDDDETFGGRSMHSVYTKSNESEAEDFFKDLFFVGSGKATNPGRRQIKHKKGYKEKYKADEKAKRQEESSEEEASLDENDGTVDQSTIDGSLTLSAAPTDFERAEVATNNDDLEYEDDDTISKTDTRSLETYDEIEADAFTMTYNYCDNMIQNIASTCGFTSTTDKKSTVENGKEDASALASNADDFSMVESFVDYATDAMFSHQKNAFSDEENTKALTDLAVNAARITHLLKHIKYDEMHDLNLETEIKLIKTSIGLPIGLVFAETDVCCWVQKIFNNGNASVASIGDKLQVGDQLAAINGVTAMHKDVAEVCRILAKTSNTALIELTFVRYIGPLRLASNEQQGYEVIDTKLSKTGRISPFKMVKKLSFSRPKSPTNTESAEYQQVITIKSKKSFDLKRRSRSTSSSSKPMQLPIPVQKAVTQSSTPTPAPVSEVAANKGTKLKKKRFRFFRNKKKQSKK